MFFNSNRNSRPLYVTSELSIVLSFIKLLLFTVHLVKVVDKPDLFIVAEFLEYSSCGI